MLGLHLNLTFNLGNKKTFFNYCLQTKKNPMRTPKHTHTHTVWQVFIAYRESYISQRSWLDRLNYSLWRMKESGVNSVISYSSQSHFTPRCIFSPPQAWINFPQNSFKGTCMIHNNDSVRSMIYSHMQNDKHFKHRTSHADSFNQLKERGMKLGNRSVPWVSTKYGNFTTNSAQMFFHTCKAY